MGTVLSKITSKMTPKVIIIATFAIVGLAALIIVRAAANGSVSVAEPAVSGGAKYVDDAEVYKGKYVQFGGETDPEPKTPDGTVKEYEKPPAVDGVKVVSAKSTADIDRYIRDSDVETIVLADGEYGRLSMDDAFEKTIWAENQYGAQFGADTITITNSKSVTVRGVSFDGSQRASIDLGGAGSANEGANKQIVIDHVRFMNSGANSIVVSNGFGTSGICDSEATTRSEDIAISNSRFVSTAQSATRLNGFISAVYVGSGGNCAFYDGTDGLSVTDNVFINDDAAVSGETIKIKTGSTDIRVSGNYIADTIIDMATKPIGAITVNTDKGLPIAERAKTTYSADNVVVMNNVIQNVSFQNGSPADVQYAVGVAVGSPSLIRNNVIANTAGAAVSIIIDTGPYSGFSKQQDAVVRISSNTFDKNGTGLTAPAIFSVNEGVTPAPFTVDLQFTGKEDVTTFPQSKTGWYKWSVPELVVEG